MKNNINRIITEYKDKSAEDILKFFFNEYGRRIALASSMSVEDQILTDMIIKIAPDARIFVIDTGRLHQETYDAIVRTMERYQKKFEIYFPDTKEVEDMETIYGPNLFYKSVKNRKMCCEIRKVRPLHRVLSSLDGWVTGLRREQSQSRMSIEKIEIDSANHNFKLNPIADWTLDMVWDYVRANRLPYNVLYDKHYRSIGCLPCTRPAKDGEDIRSGRWWWEKKRLKECGMH